MKKLLAIVLILALAMTALTAFAEDGKAVNWAYGAMPLNNGNVGTIYYAKAYYAIEGIVNPTNPEYAPYTAEEIAAIVDGAVEGAEGYRFDVPADALIGVTVADTDTIYWYDDEAAAAIVGHPDPLTLDAGTGAFVTAEGEAVATPIQSNIEKALALIGTFASGDAGLAASLLKEDYIQHNLAYGTGRDAFVGSVQYLASAEVPTTVENIRAFEDGDYVFLQTIYNFAGAGEQVAFDIFRFEDGLIAEHWDNLAALAEPNPSGHTQIDGTMEITDLDKTEKNRELVKNFLVDVMQNQHPEKTADYFDGDAYIQHNTGIADGLSSLGEALAALGDQGIYMIYDETHMILAQGNFVLAVSEGSFGGEPTSYYDLWRVENGKIAEHWDVMETIAEQNTWANENGKF